MSNLRKVITAMGSASSLALILSGTAMAAPPAVFNTGDSGWSVNTAGDVVGVCLSGSTCVTVANGAGFLQQEVTIGADRYVRTMIAEGFATGTGLARLTFASEDFVKLGGTGGLASAMTIKEGVLSPSGTAAGSITTGFSSTATILAGLSMVANTANKSEAILGLNLSDQGADPDGAGALTAAAAGGDEFLTHFSVTANTTTGGVNVTKSLGVGQTVYVGGATAVGDRQRFVTLIEDATTAQTAFKFAANATDATTLAWAIGDKIQVVWAGQDIGGAGAFSTESVKKVALANGTLSGLSVSGSNLSSSNTFEWTTTAPVSVLFTEFSTAPTF